MLIKVHDTPEQPLELWNLGQRKRICDPWAEALEHKKPPRQTRLQVNGERMVRPRIPTEFGETALAANDEC
jgi:hypothetical protein